MESSASNNSTSWSALIGAIHHVVVLGASAVGITEAVAAADRNPGAEVVLITRQPVLPPLEMGRLSAHGVTVVLDDPCWEVAPDPLEGGGVVATETGRMFEYDVLLEFPEATDA